MTVVELVSPETAPFFFYGEEVVSAEEARRLVEFFAATPERRMDDADPSTEFVFVTHTRDPEGLSRAEAAAGDPVWLGAEWGGGVPIPGELRFLQQRVIETADGVDFRRLLGFKPSLSFTSTYVDRYLPGGGFYAHTDGDRYGSVIAGVSIGPGAANFALWPDDRVDRPPLIEFTVEPNSVYFFCGPIRHHPWRHALRDVTGLRYGITWRSPPDR